jgi:crotonobetainyl-CoA:carnitine CoA-transferase CaiB-like acyl-CoA transferase
MSTKPLQGLKVANFGMGMAPALIAKFLAEQGADVVRVEPSSGDPFFGIYPAYALWHTFSRVIDQSVIGRAGGIRDWLADYDICILGGEDHPDIPPYTTPADMEGQGRLVILHITGAPLGMAPLPAVDVLAQARSGLVHEHYSSRPNLQAFRPADYGVVFGGLLGIFAALYDRERTGQGQVVSISYLLAALTWTLPFLWEAERANATFNGTIPKDTYPLLFRCSDGGYVHVVLGVPDGPAKLYRAIGIDESLVSGAGGTPQPGGDPKAFFGDVDLMQEYFGRITSKAALSAVRREGVPIEPALAPGECWSDEQVAFNGVISQTDDGRRHVGFPIKMSFQPGPVATTYSGTAEKPFDGVNILDFGMYVAGPMASTWLGDLGAKIIKVEPFRGDANRSIFRSFASVNRGKKTLLLDMKMPEGNEIVRQLCRRADIITSNFRPGIAAKLGLDPTTVHTLRENIITLETSGYGSTGPNAMRPAFDPVMQALGGHEVRAGGKDNPPLWSRTVMVDFAAGLLGAVSLALALYHRRRSGEVAALSVSLIDASIFLLSEVVSSPSGELSGGDVLNSSQTGFLPTECLYQARDGWLAIAGRGTNAIGAMMRALGLPTSPPLPDQNIHAAINSSISSKSMDEVTFLLRGTGAWVERCHADAGGRILRDPVMQKLGFIQSSNHPEFGRIAGVGASFKLAKTTSVGNYDVPAPGQNGREILRDIGWSEVEIDRLSGAEIAR